MILSAPSTIESDLAFCGAILPEVSRSFALIIPQCPPPIDRALCVAYLLCRVADTIEDESGIPDEQRQRLYDQFLAAVDDPASKKQEEAFRAAWPGGGDVAYDRLIDGVGCVLRVFAGLDDAMRCPIRICVHDMVAGMRQASEAETIGGISFVCADLSELDAYCHHVAGTVGLMSNALFETRFAPSGIMPIDLWREQGRRLGLGLQMTNIIKDCRVDGQRGVSFIPSEFVDLACGSYVLRRSRMAELFEHAIAHLDAALRFIEAVPGDETGIRTFLLGSFLPAIATLEVAVAVDSYHPKIDREKMKEIFDLIQQHVADSDAIRAWYEQHRRRTLGCLRDEA